MVAYTQEKSRNDPCRDGLYDRVSFENPRGDFSNGGEVSSGDLWPPVYSYSEKNTFCYHVLEGKHTTLEKQPPLTCKLTLRLRKEMRKLPFIQMPSKDSLLLRGILMNLLFPPSIYSLSPAG